MDFSAPLFSSAWLRRTYTVEWNQNSPILSGIAGRQNREAAIQKMRYGNNITILFRACFRLSRFYGTPGFWPAIAKGWSISPGATEDVVDLFVRARHIYRNRQGTGFSSGATVAVDHWIRYLDNFRGRSDVYRPYSDNYEPDPASARMAELFYEASRTKFLQDDAAAVLSRRGIEETQRPVRKRSPSPTPLERHRDAKRRPNPDWFDEPPVRSASTSNAFLPPKPPLTLDLERGPEPSKQEYPTPTSIARPHSDQHAFSLQAPPVENYERKIRGLAQKGSRSPTPKESIESVPETQSSFPNKERKATGAQVENSGPIQGTIEHPRTTPVECAKSGLVTTMQTRIESLEKRLLEAEAEREKDAGGAKALIASYEARMAQLEESRSAQAVLMQMMQAKLALMDSKPATQHASASVESDASVSTALECHQKDMLQVHDRLSTLEDQGESLCRTIKGLSQAHTSNLSPTPPEDIQRSMEDMVRKVKTLPTMSKLSEKAFQIEQQLEASLSEYRRNNDERMQRAERTVETVQAQVRGLTKEFDKATECLPKTKILMAVQEKVARLGKEVVAVQESKVGDKQLVLDLTGKVDVLSAKMHDQSLASLPDRIQEVSNQINILGKRVEDFQTESLKSLVSRVEEMSDKTNALEKKVEDVQAETPSEEEMASINERINVLTRSFLALLDHLHGRGAGMKASASRPSNRASNPNVEAQPTAPQAGNSSLPNANASTGAA